jgi:hypothetical protein
MKTAALDSAKCSNYTPKKAQNNDVTKCPLHEKVSVMKQVPEKGSTREHKYHDRPQECAVPKQPVENIVAFWFWLTRKS